MKESSVITKTRRFKYVSVGRAAQKISDTTGDKYIECKINREPDSEFVFYLYKNKDKKKDIHPDYIAAARKETVLREGLKTKRPIENNFYDIGAAWINPKYHNRKKHIAAVLEDNQGGKNTFYLFKDKSGGKPKSYDITEKERRSFSVKDMDAEELGIVMVVFIILAVIGFLIFAFSGKGFSF